MKQVCLLLIFQLLVNYRLNVPGCKDVSVPVEHTYEQIASQLKDKIVDGICNIVPQRYEKIVLINDKLIKNQSQLKVEK